MLYTPVVAGCADATVLNTAFGVVVISISADVVVLNGSSGVVRPSVAVYKHYNITQSSSSHTSMIPVLKVMHRLPPILATYLTITAVAIGNNIFLCD